LIAQCGNQQLLHRHHQTVLPNSELRLLPLQLQQLKLEQ
jgi:hypothetical protein